MFRKSRLFFSYPEQTSLGMCRFVFFSLVLIIYFRQARIQYIPELELLYEPSGFFALFHLPPPGPWISFLEKIWHLSLVFSAVGFLTRISTVTAFMVGFYIVGLPWQLGYVNHSVQAVIICMGILAMSRSGQDFSIDDWIRNRRGKPLIQTDETWALRLCQLTWCLVFFNAGLSKLYGGYWIPLRPEMFFDYLNATELFKRPFALKFREVIYQNPSLAVLLGAGALTLELSAPLAFFKRGRWQFFVVLGMALMQFGIYFILGVVFLRLAPLYVFWIPWKRLSSLLSKKKDLICSGRLH